jgi:hypothetical protein
MTLLVTLNTVNLLNLKIFPRMNSLGGNAISQFSSRQ